MCSRDRLEELYAYAGGFNRCIRLIFYTDSVLCNYRLGRLIIPQLMLGIDIRRLLNLQAFSCCGLSR